MNILAQKISENYAKCNSQFCEAEADAFNRAEQLIEMLTKLEYGQMQYHAVFSLFPTVLLSLNNCSCFYYCNNSLLWFVIIYHLNFKTSALMGATGHSHKHCFHSVQSVEVKSI